MNPAPELHDEPVVAPESAKEPAVPQRGLLVRLRDYAWDWRAVVAVGIAMFIVGGLAGLALGLAMGNGNNGSQHGDRFGPGGHFHRGGLPGGQVPGQGFRPGDQAPNGS